MCETETSAAQAKKNQMSQENIKPEITDLKGTRVRWAMVRQRISTEMWKVPHVTLSQDEAAVHKGEVLLVFTKAAAGCEESLPTTQMGS